MRFGWLLPETGARDVAAQAEECGFDVVWLDERPGRSATAAAAALAVDTRGVRVGVTVGVGSVHPIEIAEEAAVADLALGGRLVLAVRAEPGTEDRLPEVLDLLLDSHASHPFRHPGPVWPSPANLAENVFNLEDRLRVTPAPAQLELPVWVAGAAGRDDAVERGLGVVADADEDPATLAAWWSEAARRHPVLRRRVRRAARWVPPTDRGRLDVAAAVAQLRERQRSFDLDLVVVVPPDGAAAAPLMSDLATLVRPRIQLDRLPPGLDEHWTEHQAQRERQNEQHTERHTDQHPDHEGDHHG